jgi:hypothetical protein
VEVGDGLDHEAGLLVLADTGKIHAAGRLVELLADRVDSAELRAIADIGSGDFFWLLGLIGVD